MALVTVYDADGVEYQKETVDARECVQVLGFTYEKVQPKVEIEAQEEVILPSVEQKTRKSRLEDVKV